MSFEPREYLRHILDEATYLESATAGVSRAAFLEDPTLQRACVRSFEIIGEATKKIPAELRAAHPDVAWNARHQTARNRALLLLNSEHHTQFDG